MWLLLIAFVFFSDTEVYGMGLGSLQGEIEQLKNDLSESQAKLMQLQEQKDTNGLSLKQ